MARTPRSLPDVSRRRLAHAARAASDDCWHVRYQGWVLLTPAGQHVNLTGIERMYFLCLLASPLREMPRVTLAQALPRSSLRTVNVTVSRLRKKIEATGTRLPLQTVHGMGYVFLGKLIAEPTASPAPWQVDSPIPSREKLSF